MFNSFVPEPIEFRSNPPIHEQIVTVADKDSNGNICNSVVRKPASNKSPFEGVTYDPATMSLRAQLNLGLKLTEVAMPSMYSDPLKPLQNMQKVEGEIFSKLDSLENELKKEDIE